MVPQYFLPISAIPLSPSGKVDRKSLPIPTVTESRLGRVDPPADPVETTIAAIWTKLVRPSRPLGRTDRFFDIGGHSLLGLEALRQIDEQLGARLDPSVLYLETLADVAARCRRDHTAADVKRERADRPQRLAPDAPILLSEGQERVYRAWLTKPDGLQYNLPFAARLVGALDEAALVGSLRAIFGRHVAMRSAIASGDAGPVQKVMPVEEMCVLERSDVSDRHDPDAAAMAIMIAETKRPFDLHTGPMIRLHLINVSDDNYDFFFLPHQIAFDGWSYDIVLAELESHYTQLASGGSVDPAIPALSYGDYTTWRRRNDSTGDHAVANYWKTTLTDLPRPIEWPGAGATKAEVAQVAFVIPTDAVARYEAFCADQNVGMQTLLLAAFARVLGEKLGRFDLLIGLASSGRFIPEVVRMVGLFYNDLPLRLRLTGNERAGELLQTVHAAVQGSMGFQNVSLDQLESIAASVGSAGRSWHQVTFSYQDARKRMLNLGALRFQPTGVPRPDILNDLEFWVRQTAQELVAVLDYRAAFLTHPVVEGLRDDLVATLNRIVDGPTASIAGIVHPWPAAVRGTEPGPSAQPGRKGIVGWIRGHAGV
jgi:hypothetical protein